MGEHRLSKVLLVEDNPGDVELFKLTLARLSPGTEVAVAWDGVEAMRVLRAPEERESAALPDFVVLDLNLPRKSGPEVLDEMVEEPNLASVPVAILTSSSAHEELVERYSMHPRAYHLKPLGLAEFESTVESLLAVWRELSAGSAEP